MISKIFVFCGAVVGGALFPFPFHGYAAFDRHIPGASVLSPHSFER